MTFNDKTSGGATRVSIRILHPREYASLTPEARQLVMVYLGVQPHSDPVLERSLEDAVLLARAEGAPLGVEAFKALFSCVAVPIPGMAPWDEEGDEFFFSSTRWAS